MKRRAIKISVAALIVVGIFLSLLVAMVCNPGPEMSFSFLEGRTLTGRIKEDPGKSAYRITQEVYSFQADFKSVCARAEAELSAMGFERISLDAPYFWGHHYRLQRADSQDLHFVRIAPSQFRVHSTPKSSKDSSSGHYVYNRKAGWVSVEVGRWRPRFWPPQYLLNRLLTLRRTANNPTGK